MATDTIITTAAAADMLDALTALMDGGTVQIRSGTKPADPSTAPGDGTLLASITLNNPAFGAAAADSPATRAVAAADDSPALSDATADATGTASWFRVLNSASPQVAVMDGTVGTSDADMIVNTTSLVSGSPFSITSWEIRMPTGE